MMQDVLTMLSEGDLRTTGAADKVVGLIVHDQELFDQVFDGLFSNDTGLRMRCADAAEKASAQNPALLAAHKAQLLGPVATVDQQEVQWHVAQMLPRLGLTVAERNSALKILEGYFTNSPSNIVRANSLQAIVELASGHDSLAPTANKYLQLALDNPAHALQARARRLLRIMK